MQWGYYCCTTAVLSFVMPSPLPCADDTDLLLLLPLLLKRPVLPCGAAIMCAADAKFHAVVEEHRRRGAFTGLTEGAPGWCGRRHIRTEGDMVVRLLAARL